MPRAAVVFASDAPPVAASRSLESELAGDPAARATSRAEASVFSIGGWPAVRRQATHVRRRSATPTRRSISAAASSKASAVTARRSTCQLAALGTTFGRVPPWMTPTLTVTVGQRPFSAWSAITWCAASRIADRPFSGSTPACAARPVIVTW